MILSETLWTSNTFSIHSSATNTPTPAVPLLFPDQNSLYMYLVSLPLIIRQWPPRYLISCKQQTSILLWHSVSTISHTLPLRVFTLSVPTLSFIRCLLCLPKRPDPASRTWVGAKLETLLAGLWCLPAPSNLGSVDSAIHLWRLLFCRITCPSWHPNSDIDVIWDAQHTVPALWECALL